MDASADGSGWRTAGVGAGGVVLVSPLDFLARRGEFIDVTSTTGVLLTAFAYAADGDGVVWDFDAAEFYRTSVAAALGEDREVGEGAPVLVFDAFAEMVLEDVVARFVHDERVLVRRVRGDAVDFHLCVPVGGRSA